ncbi:anti-sigma factor [Hymenobacter taeanensis]|uniref:Regulator of SigK n=1 Tax=Hymenobacter taeanensis TaxID=2735321 RepID=A0A6M6BKH0_9BACT|nr:MULTISPECIES: anti-sigma factor [Hymenobacter]QJX48358.1 anti-sigma factor [Hymenobacter taeanensis]UOQ82150.1 anti-sigma factor [Hymenobacter sp. 5414T-23]
MNIQEYIESGILEEYALGVLDEAERPTVERMAAQHPEIRRELDEITRGLDFYAEAHAVTPPAGMRERVLSGWQQAIQQTPVQPLAAPVMQASAPEPVAAEEVHTGGVVRQMPTEESNTGRTRWLIAASVALLMLSALGNFLLYNRLKETEANLEVAQTEQSRFAATQQAALNERDQQLRVLRNEAFRAVELKGTPKAPDALARVYYNPQSKAVYVDVRNLPALPEGKQYQLWALDNGKPVDAGVLAVATAAGDSIQQMKDIASAQAFAMTVEPVGGSASPTLTTMTVLGNI